MKRSVNFRAAAGLVLIAALFLGACERKNLSPMPSIDDDTKRRLDSQRVNCGTARRDIKILEEERASIAKQILSGVRSVLPIAAVAGILMGDYGDRVEVATGQYNSDIDAKIAQIQRECF